MQKYVKQLENRIKELEAQLKNKAAEKMPHSFVTINWACGHEGPAVCQKCYQELIIKYNELKESNND